MNIAVVYKCTVCPVKYTVPIDSKDQGPIKENDSKYMGGINKDHKKKKCKGKLFYVSTLIAR